MLGRKFYSQIISFKNGWHLTQNSTVRIFFENVTKCNNMLPKCINIYIYLTQLCTYQWRHNESEDISNHQLHDCLFKRLFRRRLKKTSKPCVTGLCGGNSPVTGEFPAQRASNAENVSIWWRHHGLVYRHYISHEEVKIQVNFLMMQRLWCCAGTDVCVAWQKLVISIKPGRSRGTRLEMCNATV